ncbi:MAG: hypothetical protein U9Q04_05505 [Campylobacterota bacterium]|nr:hypothetical protein [Campylobacterota bacterium]
MKFLLAIFILITTAFGDISFKETRYISAVDMERDLYGSFKFIDDHMVISYIRPAIQTITYLNDSMSIKNKDGEISTYSYAEYPQARYMSMLLKAIINDQYESIAEIFTITKQTNMIRLDAKSSISSTISSINIKKENSTLNSILINMTNKDTIKIEITN